MSNNAPAKEPGNPLERLLARIDNFQQNHRKLAFPFAVVKKYGDDETGYEGALITYYGFLSLFPLLIVATSIVDLISQHNLHLRTRLLADINSYFPIIGSQLQSSVHNPGKTGLALALGLLAALYGARGVADATRHALNHIGEVPRTKRAGFPKSLFKSLGLIAGGGLGFLITAILSSYATGALGHSLAFRLLPILLSFVMLVGVFTFIFTIGSSAHHSLRKLLPGAAVAAVGLQILQTLGGYMVTHQLRNLKGAYGQFGLVLAILFWLYLQAQVFLYAAQINAVRAFKLWPRGLTGNPLTPADHRAFELYAKREIYEEPGEEVQVDFKK